jgi:hypothetical protein
VRSRVGQRPGLAHRRPARPPRRHQDGSRRSPAIGGVTSVGERTGVDAEYIVGPRAPHPPIGSLPASRTASHHRDRSRVSFTHAVAAQAQSGRASWAHSTHETTSLDLSYVRTMIFVLQLWILSRTVRVVVCGIAGSAWSCRCSVSWSWGRGRAQGTGSARSRVWARVIAFAQGQSGSILSVVRRAFRTSRPAVARMRSRSRFGS